MVQCKRIGQSFLLTQHFRHHYATSSYYISHNGYVDAIHVEFSWYVANVAAVLWIARSS